MEDQIKTKNQEVVSCRDLLEEVGDSGVYQNILTVVILIIAVESSVIVEGNPYIFAVAPYTNCTEPHKGITLCTQYACSLPFNQRAQF